MAESMSVADKKKIFPKEHSCHQKEAKATPSKPPKED